MTKEGHTTLNGEGMVLKHRSKFITPMIDQIEDPMTRTVFQDLLHQLSDLWPNVFDDLKNDGLIEKDFDNSALKLLQGVRLNRSLVAASPYTVLAADCIIGVDTTGAVTINLPAAATAGAGKVLYIKDETGNAAAENITIDAAGSETIDGSLTETILTNYGYRVLYCNGTEWLIMGSN
jgi:hypothetical protein